MMDNEQVWFMVIMMIVCFCVGIFMGVSIEESQCQDKAIKMKVGEFFLNNETGKVEFRYGVVK